MSLLDDRGSAAAPAASEAAWYDFLRETGVDVPQQPGRPLSCRWVPDPAVTDRMICVWGPEPG